jgi:hypothetical protein
VLRLPVAATALIFFKMIPALLYHYSDGEIYPDQAGARVNRRANGLTDRLCQNLPVDGDFGMVVAQQRVKEEDSIFGTAGNALE